MKAEPAIIIAFTICIFLTFYFVYMSFQTTEENLRKELVALALYSLVAGAAMLACITLYIGIKRIFISEELKSETEQD
ncbi:MAG: hypothetical protein QXX51_03965 [Candidatus Bathyarchaeia archaeon]